MYNVVVRLNSLRTPQPDRSMETQEDTPMMKRIRSLIRAWKLSRAGAHEHAMQEFYDFGFGHFDGLRYARA